MAVKTILEADRPEAEGILECLERRHLDEEGVVLCLERAIPPLWQVAIYWPDGDRAAAEARTRDALGTDAFGAPLTSELLADDTNWVGQSLAGLSPVRVGRFVVHGRHDRDGIPIAAINIEVEAAQAFGTGHHGTTAGCLDAIDRLARRRNFKRVLDVGTGSGVLAIALAKATRARVMASDIDPIAISIAEHNARINRVRSRLDLVVSAGLSSATIRSNAPFDLIVANILAWPLIRLAPAMPQLLAPGGWVVLSGLLPAQRSRVVHAFAAVGIHLRQTIERDGWNTLLLLSGKKKLSGDRVATRCSDRRDRR